LGAPGPGAVSARAPLAAGSVEIKAATTIKKRIVSSNALLPRLVTQNCEVYLRFLFLSRWFKIAVSGQAFGTHPFVTTHII
jgi:hypothetical protein